MKPIMTDNYDFPRMIEEGCTYVDKTDVLESLITGDGGSQFFFARPRRFGKSLMLNTLHCIFDGRKELFKGTAIGRSKTYPWVKYPVIHLDLSRVVASTPEMLEKKLNGVMRMLAQEMKAPFSKEDSSGINFETIITHLAEKDKSAKRRARADVRRDAGRVVVLIDEYDAPVNGFIDDPEKMQAFRDVMHQFFLTLKANVKYIRFLMATGVTRFTKISLFSCLNNPTDLSMDARAARLCGYTPEEIEKYFHEHIQAFADAKGISYDEMFGELLDWYDSYRFSPESPVNVCNPVSFGKALVNKLIMNYWEATGLASSAVRQIRESEEIISDWNDVCVTRTSLDASDMSALPIATLLYQTGYLTIKDAFDDGTISLRVPNKEVLDSVNEGSVSRWLNPTQAQFSITDAKRTRREMLEGGELSVFTDSLMSCYSRIPHEWVCKDEAEAKRFFQLYCYFMGARIKGEHETSCGRADAVIEYPNGVYILEFKYGKTPAAALRQIRERRYADAYRGDKRPVWLVGCNYNPRKRGLDKPLVRRVIL